MKLITIIMPNYNNPYLYEAIDSVISQTYGFIQLVIIDDCSKVFDKDKVENYIERHKRPNLVEYDVIVNENNIGTVKNLNKAFKYAKGDIIFNLAGDDVFYDNNVISEWVDFFEKNNAEVVTACRAMYDEKMQKQIDILPTQDDINILNTARTDIIWDRLCQKNFVFGCCTARTREMMEHIGYDESYKLIEDYPWNLKITRQGVLIYFWNRVAVKYRSGGISSPAKFDGAYLKDSIIILFKEILPYSKHKRKDIISFVSWLRNHIRIEYFT